MKIKRFIVGFTQTKRTGQFENIKPTIEVEVEVENQENFEAQVEETFGKCRKIILNQLKLGGVKTNEKI